MDLSYNYDVWLERILNSLGLKYNVFGVGGFDSDIIELIKPHGSISFIPKNHMDRYDINYKFE